MTVERTPLDRCSDCSLVVDRRAFLVNAAMAAAATLAAIGSSPGRAFAATVHAIEPHGANGAERSYPIPATDGVSIDVPHGVILARWQGAVYAFSARCPHRGARLTWRPVEGQVFCPKH